MKVLSLFSGVGGFDMGLENAGMETVFQCEWDKHANSILHKHWPEGPKWDDVSTLTGKHILAHAPVIDVVAWGSPCQDLSGANTNRTGLEGNRSGLFYEGIRIIKELQEESNGQYPRISIWENVVGALSSNRGADFGVILDEMAKAGALAIEWSVLDAQYFGIPQRRRRVFVIAIFDPLLASRCSNPLLPVCKSIFGDITKSKQSRQNTSRTTTKGTRTSNAIIGSDIVGSLAASDYKFPQQQQQVNENKIVVEPYGIQGNVIGRQHQNGPAGKGYTNQGDPMFTLTSTDRHAIAEPTAVRRLTPLECERLMGWPDDHTRYKADGTEQADTHRYKQCGNGVASPVAQWIAKHILNI